MEAVTSFWCPLHHSIWYYFTFYPENRTCAFAINLSLSDLKSTILNTTLIIIVTLVGFKRSEVLLFLLSYLVSSVVEVLLTFLLLLLDMVVVMVVIFSFYYFLSFKVLLSFLWNCETYSVFYTSSNY